MSDIQEVYILDNDIYRRKNKIKTLKCKGKVIKSFR